MSRARGLAALLLALSALPATASPQPPAQPPAPAATSPAPAPRPEPAAPPRPALETIPSPDLAQLEPAVAKQIGEAQDLLAAAVTKAAEAPGNHPELADAYGDLGRLYQAYDLRDAATACYRNAALLAPFDFHWPYFLAALAQKAGHLEQATAAYEKVLELKADDLPTLIRLGDVLFASGRLADATVRYEEALDVDPKVPAALAGLGEVMLARDRPDIAVTRLEEALRLVPGANRLHYPLGLAYRKLGQEDKAREHLLAAGTVGVRPPDPLLDQLTNLTAGEIVHLLRGRKAFYAKRYGDAAEEFAKAVEARPDSVAARVNLGTALALGGDVAKARTQLEEAVRLEPENTTALFDLGSLLLHSGDAAAAVGYLEKAARLAPSDGSTQQELATALRGVGRLDEALEHYRQAAELAPEDESATLGEAGVLVDLKRYAEARQLLEKAHAQMPLAGLTAHALARLLAACPDLGLRDGARAVELAQRVVEASPTIIHAETMAMALAETGRCEEAASWQRQAADAARQGGDAARAAELAKNLPLYERGAPCRYPGPGSDAAKTPEGHDASGRKPTGERQ